MILLFTDVGDTIGYGKYAGTYKVATEVRAAGYPTQVIDHFRWMGITRLKKVLDKFCNEDTIIIGLSLTLMAGYRDATPWGITYEHMQEFAEYAKKINPNVKIIAGGPQVTTLFNHEFFDYGVLHKGDNALIAIADHITKGTDLKYIQPIHTKIVSGNDYWYSQEDFATSKIIWEDSDIIQENEALPIEIARGCIFKCAYCYFDLIGKRIGDWTKTEDTLVEELTYNYKKYGVTSYMVADELVNESIPKLEMLVRVNERLPFNFTYTSYARIDMIYRYPQMIELLPKSGAVGLAFGIETFDPTAGKAVGKGMSAEKVKYILEECKKAWKDKVLISSNFIMGLPGETEESIRHTIDYLIQDDCPIDAFEINVLNVQASENERAGNAIGDNPEKFNMKIKKGKHKARIDMPQLDWEHDHLSLSRARDLFHEFTQIPKIKNGRKLASATYIGRILSLGYSLKEVFDLIKDQRYDSVMLDLRLKSNKMKQNYYERLMEL